MRSPSRIGAKRGRSARLPPAGAVERLPALQHAAARMAAPL